MRKRPPKLGRVSRAGLKGARQSARFLTQARYSVVKDRLGYVPSRRGSIPPAPGPVNTPFLGLLESLDRCPPRRLRRTVLIIPRTAARQTRPPPEGGRGPSRPLAPASRPWRQWVEQDSLPGLSAGRAVYPSAEEAVWARSVAGPSVCGHELPGDAADPHGRGGRWAC
jgi:hypothetical protein